MQLIVLASVALHQLILDADRRKMPYDRYNFKESFANQATREHERGGGFMSVADRALLNMAECPTLQQLITQRDQNTTAEVRPLVHVSLTSGEQGVEFILTSPKFTKH